MLHPMFCLTTFKIGMIGVETGVETAGPKVTQTRPSVLVVDDRPENLLALEGVLGPLDCHLVKALSGAEALKHLLSQDFAVILLDVQMPEMDGYETASLIKQRELSRHIPIIFVTAINKEPGHVFQGYSSGAVDYILKPFEPDILKSKVAVFLDLWRKTEIVKQQAELLRQSEQRKAEQLLAESAELLDRFKPPLEAILDGIFMFEAQTWRLSYLNKGAMRQLGYHDDQSKEFEGKTVLDILLEFDDTSLRTLLAPLEAEAKNSLIIEALLRSRNGQQTPFEMLIQT